MFQIVLPLQEDKRVNNIKVQIAPGVTANLEPRKNSNETKDSSPLPAGSDVTEHHTSTAVLTGKCAEVNPWGPSEP